MKKYFNIQELKKDIHLVTENFFSEHANLYIIKGADRDVLIDSGLGLSNVKSFLIEKGFHPDVFLTHSHFDHAGGLKHFLASEILVTPAILSSLSKKELWGVEFLKPEMFTGISKTTAVKFTNDFQICVPFNTMALAKNEIVIGHNFFEIILTPGHTNDSVVLYDANKKLLITGDTLYDGEPYVDFANSNTVDLLNSLQYLASLDFEFVLSGHNAPMDREQALLVIKRWIAQLRSR